MASSEEVRRKFFDVHDAAGLPIAQEALDCICQRAANARCQKDLLRQLSLPV